MNRISKIFLKIIALTTTLLLFGCSEPGLVIKNGPAGPNTGDLIDPLPEGLGGDKQNARHGSDDLRPNIN